MISNSLGSLPPPLNTNDLIMQNSGIVAEFILDKILSLGISKWDKIVFYAIYGESSYEMDFFIKNGNAYRDASYLINSGISFKTLVSLYITLNKEIQKMRKGVSRKNLWTVLTITYNSDMTFNANYDYSVIEDISSFKLFWKNKFLI